jgi:biopolymer transport protein ExbB/TolQ
MAITPSQRPTREWPLLVLAVALVAAVCVPLKQWLATSPLEETAWAGTVQRGSRLLLGPEQITCYCFFTWAAFILLSRYLEVLRQRRAFRLGLLPTEEGARILPEDARPLQRKVEHITRGQPYVLANLVRLALGKYALSRSGEDVSETVRTQADVDLGRLVTGMATVHFLAWAIPAVGFFGTVRGLAMSMGLAGRVKEGGIEQFLATVTEHLDVAFDCTLVALALSIPIMFLIHSVQRDEEALVIDCQQYCLEHLVNRLYDPEPIVDEAAVPAARITPGKRAPR